MTPVDEDYVKSLIIPLQNLYMAGKVGFAICDFRIFLKSYAGAIPPTLLMDS